MAIERFEAHHIELIYRSFHGNDAAPTDEAALGHVLSSVAAPDFRNTHSCTRLAAIYAVELFRAKPWGQQTADTAMVTALVLMRLCGADIEAGKNYDLYDHLRLQPSAWDYERTLQSFLTHTGWSDVVCRAAFYTEQNLGGLNSPFMLTRIRQEVVNIASNFLINPLHGFERPKPPGPTVEELIEQDRQEQFRKWAHQQYSRDVNYGRK